MSIIGTRPPLISETNLYELHHRARLAIKPGITGMWQVSGRSDITDFEEVVRLDKEYITNWNIGLDIKILFKTILVAYNVLSALYQPFWAAVLLAFLTMFLYLYGTEHGWKKNNFIRNMFATWWRAFKSSSNFRRTFLLAFYTAMILLRTVLNREIWFDPLGKIFGGWGLYEDGQFTTESIENFMLFVPFSILLLWAFQKELLDESENIRFA